MIDYKNATLEELICQVRELADSKENDIILQRWQDTGSDVSVTDGASVWHGVPTRKVTATSVVPYTVDPEGVYYSKALPFSMKGHFTNAEDFLINTLKMKLIRYDLFHDDAYMTKDISLFLGVILEASQFGVPSIYPEDTDPWNAHEPVIRGPEDLAKFEEELDFYNAGIMPRCHEFYNTIKSMLPDDFTVSFPLWGRGPWGVAQHLMTLDELYVNAIEEPEFVDDLLKMIVRQQKAWLQKRADLIGIPLPVGAMYNDEVNAQLISPSIYEELIFPREQELALYQNGLSYWHSCGNTAPLLKNIKKLHKLEMYDCSAWTDWETVAKELQGQDIAVEVRMHPVKDVIMADEAHMREKLTRFREIFGGMRATVRADGFQVVRSMEEDTKQIQKFAQIAAEMLR